MDAAKLLIILVAIVFALRKKVSVGVVLFGAGLLMALLFRLPLRILLNGYVDLIKSQDFILLTSVVVLITFLGALLKEIGFLGKLSSAVEDLPGGRRTATVLLPPMIGMMPMPGGSLLSAPLVGNVLSHREYPPEFKVVTNYWFRHIAEFFWPLYAGIILTEAITGMPMVNVSMMQIPLSLIMVTIGLIVFIRQIDRSNSKSGNIFRSLYQIGSTIWPIGLAIILFGILNVNLAIAVLIAIVLLIIIARPSKNGLVVPLKRALSFNLIMLVFGVLSFQMIIEKSRAVDFIPNLATTYHLPEEAVVFLVCFTIGLLTGVVSAYVGLGYSLLAGFLYQPQFNPGLVMIAYLSGFTGVMLSPSHLCLILTNEYFSSDLLKVYRLMIPPMIILMVCGFILYWLGWPDIFK